MPEYEKGGEISPNAILLKEGVIVGEVNDAGSLSGGQRIFMEDDRVKKYDRAHGETFDSSISEVGGLLETEIEKGQAEIERLEKDLVAKRQNVQKVTNFKGALTQHFISS